jgi:uncharacterized membrane protein
MSWRLRWKIYEYVRDSLWIVPGLFLVLAITLGVLLPDLDEGTTTRIGLAFGSGAAAAILGAIAGGMITFTGFVFSVLLLAVQFGSSQFSPRMLRRFLRDPVTKISLGVFIATFIYALMVLRTIGLASDPKFVPDNSITVALFWLLLSMLLFLRLISKTTQGLRVASVVRDLGRDGAREIASAYPVLAADATPDESAPRPVAETSRLVEYGGAPGVLQSLDVEGLVRLAQQSDIIIELNPAIGDFIASEAALFRIVGPGAVDEGRLRRSVAVGDERTMRQDPGFALRLLADISSKALSPGINDPTTSVQALDQVELLLRMLAQRQLSPGERRDGSGQVRLRYPTHSWDDFLSIALDEARVFGAGSAQVTRRLRALLDDLHAAVPPPRRPAVAAQQSLLEACVRSSYPEPAEQAIAATADRQGLGSSRSREPDPGDART